MAKKSSSKSKDKVDNILDAEEVPVDAVVADDSVDTVAEDIDEAATPDNVEDVVEAVEDTPNDATDLEEAKAPTDAQPQPAERKQSVFMPLLLGGLVAGGIGFGAGTYLNGQSQQELSSQIATLEFQVDELEAQIAAAASVDLTPVTDTLTGLQSDVTALQSNVDLALEDLTSRVATVERQPSGDGTLPQSALDAYEGDIQALRDQLAKQQADMQDMLNETSQQLLQTQEEANAIEEQTVAAAKAATARSALARIQTALDSGSPFGAVLAELEAVVDDPLPDALTAAQDGAPTLASLVAEFPEGARNALATARSEGASGEETSGFSAFLRNQFSVRSVEPQDGSSVDAILSRAQGALSEGRLNDALSEVGSLPEVARASLSDWVAQAELRASAVDAATTLFMSFNSN